MPRIASTVPSDADKNDAIKRTPDQKSMLPIGLRFFPTKKRYHARITQNIDLMSFLQTLYFQSVSFSFVVKPKYFFFRNFVIEPRDALPWKIVLTLVTDSRVVKNLHVLSIANCAEVPDLKASAVKLDFAHKRQEI